MIGVLFPADRIPVTSVDRAPNAPAVEVTTTSAFTLFNLLIVFWTSFPPSEWYVSSATTLPPSCSHRALNACTTFLKYTITPSVARAALRHPLLHAYWAIAEPSSCATLPKLNARRPFDPNRFGPIWSVPMQGATVSRPWLIEGCTTGAARSTSHVVMITF